jgi:GT2 family glycosyltransferase
MPDAQDIDLSIIVVNWNVRELLRACLNSLCASPNVSLKGTPVHGGLLLGEVIVVDNASADGSAAMVAQDFPWVRLVANPDNRGYTGGNNQGIALSRGRHVFILNPDTCVVGDALAVLVTYMDRHPEVGILGRNSCTVTAHHNPPAGVFPLSPPASLRARRSPGTGPRIPGHVAIAWPRLRLPGPAG